MNCKGGITETLNRLNHRLLKWVKWGVELYKYDQIRWLWACYDTNPGLFAHWRLAQP